MKPEPARPFLIPLKPAPVCCHQYVEFVEFVFDQRTNEKLGSSTPQSVSFLPPQIAVIDVLPFCEPRTAAREMHNIRSSLLRFFVPAFEPVPCHRQRTDVFILRPLHAVKICARLAVDDFRRQ